MSQSKKAGTIVPVAKPSYKRIIIIAKDKQAPKKHTAGDQEKNKLQFYAKMHFFFFTGGA